MYSQMIESIISQYSLGFGHFGEGSLKRVSILGQLDPIIETISRPYFRPFQFTVYNVGTIIPGLVPGLL